MYTRNWIGLALALLTATAFAAGPEAIRKQTEASMLVTGTIVVEPDGSVSTWEIDRRAQVPEPVVELIGKSATVWRFQPVVVDGEAVKAQARMSLRVVAARHDEDSYRLTIRSGYFGEDKRTARERQETAGVDGIRSQRMDPPAYPANAAAMGVKGTVYLVLQINGQGKVDDVFAEQVNLKVAGAQNQMDRMRTMLERPAIAAARKWTFSVPATGAGADAKRWSVRVPVEYRLFGEREPEYGQWEAFIPGPRRQAPWSKGEIDPNQSPDAMIAGRIYEDGKGLKLLTPLEQG